MAPRFTAKESLEYFRSRCALQSRELEKLKTEKGLNSYLKKCEEQAEERNKGLKADLAKSEREVNKLRKTNEELNQKYNRLLAKSNDLRAENKRLLNENEALKEQIKAAEAVSEKYDDLLKQNKELQDQHEKDERDNLALQKEVVSLGGKIEKAEHKRNSQNSGVPTSGNSFEKPVQNNREPSQNKAGAKEGHKPSPRKVIEICGKVVAEVLGDQDPLWEDPEYNFCDYVVKRVYTPRITVVEQLVLVPRFRNTKTGAWKCAEHPSWINDEVNYGPETKAMLIYMRLCANIAINKCQEIMREFSNGKLNPSEGFISGLSEEFALKSEPERANAYKIMLGDGVLNIDGTTVRVGGVLLNITVCVCGEYTLYFFRPYKGVKGVKDTPIEHTTAILVHDHDVTYYNYGSSHQECLEHVSRYLKDSMEMEGDMTWNVKMREFIQKLMHEAKEADRKKAESRMEKGQKAEETEETLYESTDPHARFSPEIIESYKREFQEYCRLGITEYSKKPANKYYPDGANLCKRLGEDPESYLLFLSDDRVPYTNNAAEEKIRYVKRHLAVATSFRSILGVIAYVESMSVVQILKNTDQNILAEMSKIISRDVTAEDRIRSTRIQVTALEEVLEKDKEAISKLTRERDEAATVLDKCKNAEKEASQRLDNMKSNRIARSGEQSEPSEEEKLLDAQLKQAQADLYTAQIAFNDRSNKLNKRTGNQERNRKQLEAAKIELERLEKKKASDEEKNRDSKNEKPASEKSGSRVIDMDELKAAAADVEEKMKAYKNAVERLSKAQSVCDSILYPTSSISSLYNAAKKTFTEQDAVSPGDTAEYKAAEEKLRKADAECEEARKELNEAQRKADAARKGRRIGRRKRKSAGAQVEGGCTEAEAQAV